MVPRALLGTWDQPGQQGSLEGQGRLDEQETLEVPVYEVQPGQQETPVRLDGRDPLDSKDPIQSTVQPGTLDHQTQ